MNKEHWHAHQVSRAIRILILVCFVACSKPPEVVKTDPSASVSDLTSLVAMPSDALKQLDIARMNLICAEGLSGAKPLDVASSLAVVDQMAARVRSETERHTYRFQKNPDEFENSEAFFRMMMLMVVLAEDFKVHYVPNKMANVASASMGDGFFANAQDVFLHGLTGANHQGTCSSLSSEHKSHKPPGVI
jgi:hypothetical protein